MSVADYTENGFGLTGVQEVALVRQMNPYQKWSRDKDSTKQELKRRHKDSFDSVLKRETKKTEEKYGSFFEARI